MWAVVAVFFIVVATIKVVRGGLVEYIESSAMFTPQGAILASAAIIALEYVLALLLIWNGTRRAGWLLNAGLCSSFAVFHIFGALFGFSRACNCIGVALSFSGRTNHLIMAGLSLALVGISVCMLCRPARAATDNASANGFRLVALLATRRSRRASRLTAH